MPTQWKVTLGVLAACLIASMVIGIVKLISLWISLPLALPRGPG